MHKLFLKTVQAGTEWTFNQDGQCAKMLRLNRLRAKPKKFEAGNDDWIMPKTCADHMPTVLCSMTSFCTLHDCASALWCDRSLAAITNTFISTSGIAVSEHDLRQRIQRHAQACSKLDSARTSIHEQARKQQAITLMWTTQKSNKALFDKANGAKCKSAPGAGHVKHDTGLTKFVIYGVRANMNEHKRHKRLVARTRN